ncbi:MAG: hypothetical protein M0P97_01825 [Candidatus Moranbacteria bacterium]|jgi:hypothetical protein|nr:hypothetical protein [Candidatus Moranbacteria bacterium]
MGMQGLFVNLGLPEKISGDISMFLILSVVSVGLGMYIGRFRLVNVLINIYIAVALLGVIPAKWLSSSGVLPAIFFLAAVIFLTIIGDYLFDIHISNTVPGGFFWRLFVMSFLEMGLVFSIIISHLPKKIVLQYISESSSGYFSSPYAQIFWMVLPLVFLLFLSKKSK